MKKYEKKVCIAMSGGVDSSVVAAILKNQGYKCVGAFFVTWTKNLKGLTNCPWEQDVFDARRVCAKLDIPLYVFNFENDYKKRVVDYLFREYQAGKTPNPDIMCNKEIKFNLFLNKAKQLGVDYIATGHYAQIKKTIRGYQLLKGKDPNKDQSYFLYTLSQKQLPFILFPIGHLLKPEVRKLAKKYNLPNWDKKDSQGICFLGKVKVADFLKTKIPVKIGNIVNTKGEVVGKHQGTAFYTIGQRHGLNIGGLNTPYYVVAKDKKTNTLTVASARDKKLFAKKLEANSLNWVGQTPKLPLKCRAKIRYHQPDQLVTIKKISQDKIKVEFSKNQRAITLGQSIVLYQGKQILGGGVISKIGTTLTNSKKVV